VEATRDRQRVPAGVDGLDVHAENVRWWIHPLAMALGIRWLTLGSIRAQ
jgi:hypothetical protein